MRRLSFRWGGKDGSREVVLNLAQVAEHHGLREVDIEPNAPKSVRLQRKERTGGNWLWPAIGILVFVEVLLLGGHAVQWAKSSRHFELSKVEVKGQRALRTEEIVKLMSVEPGMNLFDADLAAIRARVAAHLWIKRASVRMRPPHFLEVNIIERKPVAYIMGGETLMVDEEGVVLGKSLASVAGCLPVVEGFASRRWRPGDVIRDPRLARSIEAAHLFQDSPVIRGECIAVRNSSPDQLRLRAPESKVELMVSAEKMESQAGRLRAVADDVLRQKELGAGGLQFDLRFPDRVIVRPLTKDGGKKG